MKSLQDSDETGTILNLWAALRRTKYLDLACQCLYAGALSEAAEFVQLAQDLESEPDKDRFLAGVRALVNLIGSLESRNLDIQLASVGESLAKIFDFRGDGAAVSGTFMARMIAQAFLNTREARHGGKSFRGNFANALAELTDSFPELLDIGGFFYEIDHKQRKIVVASHRRTIHECYENLAQEYTCLGMDVEAAAMRESAKFSNQIEDSPLALGIYRAPKEPAWILDAAEKIIEARITIIGDSQTSTTEENRREKNGPQRIP